MKAITTVLATLLFAPAIVGVPTAGAQYTWLISASASDPLANSGVVSDAPRPLYLWYFCGWTDGLTTAEFDFSAPDGATVFGFTPMNGFLNVRGPTDPLLVVGGCPTGLAVLAGVWQILDSVPGSYCLVASAANGILGCMDCDTTNPVLHPVFQIGYTAGGGTSSCDDVFLWFLCGRDAIEPMGWGGVKSLYR